MATTHTQWKGLRTKDSTGCWPIRLSNSARPNPKISGGSYPVKTGPLREARAIEYKNGTKSRSRGPDLDGSVPSARAAVRDRHRAGNTPADLLTTVDPERSVEDTNW